MFALCQKIFGLIVNLVINFILPAVVTALICLIPSSEAYKKEIRIEFILLDDKVLYKNND